MRPLRSKWGAKVKPAFWQTIRGFVPYPSAEMAFQGLPRPAARPACAAGWLALALLAAPAPAAGAAPAPRGAALPGAPGPAQRDDAGPLVRVTTAAAFGQEAPHATRLTGWDEAGPRLADGAIAEDWLRLDFPVHARTSVDPAGAWRLELRDGTRLTGTPRGGNADRLDWAWGRRDELLLIPVDLLAVRGFARERLPWVDDEQASDTLVLITPAGNDRRNGWLDGLNADGVVFAEGERVDAHPWERVAAVRLLEEAAEPLVTPTVTLALRDGSFLPLAPEALDEDGLRGRLPWGTPLTVPLRSLHAIQRRAGPFVDLVDRPADAVTHPVSEVLDWAPRRDRAVSGRPLRVAEQERTHGLGVRAPTTLAWELASGGLFTARVGVDDAVALHRRPAPLRFEVRLDGEVLASSAPVRFGEEPQPLRVEVPRAGLLELVCVSTGGPQASGRHGNWLEPRVWQAAAGP